MKRYLHFILFVMLFLTSCVQKPLVISSPLPDKISYNTKRLGFVGNGDILEVGFYRSPKVLSTPYTIGEGDVLRISVQEHPELSRNRILVLPDGCISFPFVDRMKVTGKRVDDLGSILLPIYKANNIRTSGVTVSVEETNYRLKSLLNSASKSGLNAPLIVRVDSSGFIDLPFIPPVNSGRSLEEIQHEVIKAYKDEFSGRVEVTVNLRERTSFPIYIIGEVHKPGSVVYSSSFNLLTAVAAAGGFLDSADTSSVRLYRFSEDGKYYHWPLNLKNSMDTGAEGSVRLKVFPRDIIYVPKSGVAFANQIVKQYIKDMIPMSLGFGMFYPVVN